MHLKIGSLATLRIRLCVIWTPQQRLMRVLIKEMACAHAIMTDDWGACTLPASDGGGGHDALLPKTVYHTV